MSAVGPLVRKELLELAREKRLPIFALLYAIIGASIFGSVAENAADQAARTIAPDLPAALDLVSALFFLNVTAVLILCAMFVFDAVGKERDAGMLGLLLTTPASAVSLLVAKILLAATTYAVFAVLALGMSRLISRVLGAVVWEASVRIMFGPLAVLFVYLVGTALLIGVIVRSARLALGVAFGLNLLLLLVGVTDMFSGLTTGLVATVIDLTPFAVTEAGVRAITHGAADPGIGYALTLGVGLGGLAAAFLIFARQEVPHG